MILTRVYLPQLAPICVVTDTNAKQGGWEECVCATMSAMGEGGLGPLSSGGGRLPKMEGRGVLQDLIPDVGQLVLPEIPVEGSVIDSYEHGLLDGPDNPRCFPVSSGETVHTDASTL